MKNDYWKAKSERTASFSGRCAWIFNIASNYVTGFISHHCASSISECVKFNISTFSCYHKRVSGDFLLKNLIQGIIETNSSAIDR